MVRSAAKNHQFVGIVTSPLQYETVFLSSKLAALFETRKQLAKAAFQHTAEYDGAIANYLGRDADAAQYPEKFVHFERVNQYCDMAKIRTNQLPFIVTRCPMDLVSALQITNR